MKSSATSRADDSAAVFASQPLPAWLPEGGKQSQVLEMTTRGNGEACELMCTVSLFGV
jgi:hypothetical protein